MNGFITVIRRDVVVLCNNTTLPLKTASKSQK
jgi:hypothetical protein